MTKEELEQEITKLKAEKAELLKKERNTISFKVSAKGAVSVYGLGRLPVTLYKQQWDKLIGSLGDLQAFIAENANELTVK